MATIKDLREWMRDLGGKIEIVDEGTVEDCGEGYLVFDYFTQLNAYCVDARDPCGDVPDGCLYCFRVIRPKEEDAGEHEFFYLTDGTLTRETWEGILRDITCIEIGVTSA